MPALDMTRRLPGRLSGLTTSLLLTLLPTALSAQSLQGRVEQAVAQTLATTYASSELLVVSNLQECTWVRTTDRSTCENGRLTPTGRDSARARAWRVARHIGADTVSSSAVIIDWQHREHARGSDSRCPGTPTPVATRVAIVSMEETLPDRAWEVRVIVSTFPKDSRCEGFGSVVEYTVTHDGPSIPIRVSTPRTIVHFSGMTPAR
jgi:hypothetical protein